MLSDFDIEIAARTLIGEARGEGADGMTLVAWVLRNRLSANPEFTLAYVCLRASQFSCWNTNDKNRKVIALLTLGDASLIQAKEIIKAVFSTPVGCDPTKGSRHYKTISSGAFWAKGKIPVLVHKNHQFFNNIT